MSNNWVIERDENDQKVRRQLTNAEQSQWDNRPQPAPQPAPDLTAAIQALIDGDTSAAQIAMSKTR